jgi:hypothetical protein
LQDSAQALVTGIDGLALAGTFLERAGRPSSSHERGGAEQYDREHAWCGDRG